MYKNSIDAKYNPAASLYNISICFMKLKKYHNAISYLKLAISKDPQSSYYFNLAYCYSLIKNKKKALLYFNTAWALNNDDEDCEKAINLILESYKK